MEQSLIVQSVDVSVRNGAQVHFRFVPDCDGIAQRDDPVCTVAGSSVPAAEAVDNEPTANTADKTSIIGLRMLIFTD